MTVGFLGAAEMSPSGLPQHRPQIVRDEKETQSAAHILPWSCVPASSLQQQKSFQFFADADIEKYKHVKGSLHELDLYKDVTFGLKWEDFSQVTHEQLQELWRSCEALGEFPDPPNHGGVFLSQTHQLDGEDAVYIKVMMAYQEGTHGSYHVILSRGSQRASFDVEAFESQLSQKARAREEEIGKGIHQKELKMAWRAMPWLDRIWWIFSSWEDFDTTHDIKSQSQQKARHEAGNYAQQTMRAKKESEQRIACEDCLAGYMLHEAIRTKRMLPEAGADLYHLV